MDRKLLFRAWLPDEEIMMYSNNQYGQDFNEIWVIDQSGIHVEVQQEVWKEGGGETFEQTIYVTPNQVIMSLTGLKDKNGKDIWEGDVVCNDKYDGWEWRGVIKFSHGVFGAEWLANAKSRSMVGSWGQKHNLRKLDDDIIDRLIVIGNIYENPELINE